MTNMKGTPIELDRVRHLKFTSNQMVKFEDAIEKGTVIALLDPTAAGFKIVRGLLYAGLTLEDPDLTLDQCGDFIDIWYQSGGDLDTLYRKIGDALKNDGFNKKIKFAENEEAKSPL